MPHLRDRHCLPVLLKKIAFSPVVALQGARQTGKSVLVRDLLPKKLVNLAFESFDRQVSREFASTNPESFLAQFAEHGLLAIDEAQKVPGIFDAVKLEVDRHRRPGMFILLGSTEFSKLTKIQESLTGRMTRLRLFPFTLAEAHGLPLSRSTSPIFVSEKPRVTRADLMRALRRGGLPGVFSVRSDSERGSLLRDWLDLTLQRDLMMIPGMKLSPDLASRVLTQIAQLPEPNTGQIAKTLRVDPRKVQAHLKALQTLFVIQPLPPHTEGTGKVLYFLLDVGIASLLGASFERQLHTLLLQESIARAAYCDMRTVEFYYYRGAKGGIISLVVQNGKKTSALKILAEERIDLRELMGMMAWKKKNPSVTLFALGAQRATLKKERIEIYPWEALG